MEKKYDSVWYEVFVSRSFGTETLASFDCLSTAKKFRISYQKTLPKTAKLYIDKWGLRNSTSTNERIKSII